ncbi:MAG: hypothetical protein EBU01_14350 [Crocinitomicaceae bacterium]|nr:hypothetical protein [Crocinitomicaceae bacterium]
MKTKKMSPLLKKLIKKSQSVAAKLNKHKNAQSCESFCNNDYLVEIDRAFERLRKKYKMPKEKRVLPREFDLNVCKKMYCNPDCIGFDEAYTKLPKNIDGFDVKLSRKQRSILEKKGALSACIHQPDYKIK